MAQVDVVTERVIQRPVDEVPAFARDPLNAPCWYTAIDSVSMVGEPPLAAGRAGCHQDAAAQPRRAARVRRGDCTRPGRRHETGEREGSRAPGCAPGDLGASGRLEALGRQGSQPCGDVGEGCDHDTHEPSRRRCQAARCVHRDVRGSRAPPGAGVGVEPGEPHAFSRPVDRRATSQQPA